MEGVRAVCGVQAQAAGAAEIAIAMRVDGVTKEDVRAELWKHRRVVRVWAHRGTIHVLPADELPLWTVALRGPRPYWHSREWRDRHGLTPKRVDAIVAAVGDALDGRRLTRAKLADEVSGRVGSWARERVGAQWGELLGPAAYSGLLLHGPPEGGRATFVRADSGSAAGASTIRMRRWPRSSADPCARTGRRSRVTSPAGSASTASWSRPPPTR